MHRSPGGQVHICINSKEIRNYDMQRFRFHSWVKTAVKFEQNRDITGYKRPLKVMNSIQVGVSGHFSTSADLE